jgi:hypothetical protein
MTRKYILSVVSAKEKTNLIRKKMNIDPTTSTVTEKREQHHSDFMDFRHRFQKPKSHSRMGEGLCRIGIPKLSISLEISRIWGEIAIWDLSF